MQKSLDPHRPRLAAIVLAAGGSRRLGHPKQLLRLGNTPLILRAALLAQQVANDGVIVVLGHERQRLRSLLRRHRRALRIVVNPRWHGGLSESLGEALQAVPRSAAAVLCLTVDQARIELKDLERLVRAWRARPTQPAAAHYAGRSGVPAIIPRRLFPAIRSLRGDTGAQAVLRNTGMLTTVDMPSAAFDVDTPADAALLALKASPDRGPAY